MTTKRASTHLALATVVAGLSAFSVTLTAPVASADPLDNIIATVKKDRANTRCAQLNYNPALEGAAQTYARSENPVDSQAPGYAGSTLGFLGSGDPQAAATTSAYQRGAGNLIGNCDFTEFGVGFVRHEDREVDVVTIVFGKPAAPPPPPPPPVVVPDQPKPEEQAQKPPEKVPAPTDAISVVFNRAALSVNVNISNSSDIAGSCTYVATPVNAPLLPTVTRNFNIAPRGSAQLTVPAPPPLTTYHVVTSCTGPYEGQTVQFGRDEQDVSG